MGDYKHQGVVIMALKNNSHPEKDPVYYNQTIKFKKLEKTGFSYNISKVKISYLIENMQCQLAPMPLNVDLLMLKEDPKEEQAIISKTSSDIFESKSKGTDITAALLSDLLPVIEEAEAEVNRDETYGKGACGAGCALI